MKIQYTIFHKFLQIYFFKTLFRLHIGLHVVVVRVFRLQEKFNWTRAPQRILFYLSHTLLFSHFFSFTPPLASVYFALIAPPRAIISDNIIYISTINLYLAIAHLPSVYTVGTYYYYYYIEQLILSNGKTVIIRFFLYRGGIHIGYIIGNTKYNV